MKTNLIFFLVLVFLQVNCSNGSNFSGGSKNKAAPPPDLVIKQISDKVVNSGKNSDAYSEKLVVPIETENAIEPLKLEYSISPASANPNIAINTAYKKFNWKPGYIDDDKKYQNEEGTYAVTIKAGDGGGRNVETTFNLTIKPISLVTTPRDLTDGAEMIADLMVTENFHPDRKYNHVDKIDGKSLNTAKCISFIDPEKTVTLNEVPKVTFVKKENTADGNIHNYTLELSFDREAQAKNYPEMAFVTWINLVPDPDTSVSSADDKAKTIRIYFGIERCVGDSDGMQTNCAQKVSEAGIERYFFCGDYLGVSDDQKYEKLRDMFCNLARLNGVQGEGC